MADTYTDLQRLLDSLSQTPGSILYRDDNAWKALPPGEIGQVLAIDNNLRPYWAWPSELNL